MGNTCLHKLDSQKQKMIKINGYPKLNYPKKLILEPSIQNITQNLDTFDDEFFKNEFQFDIQSDNQRNQSTKKVQLISCDEQINRLNQSDFPLEQDQKCDLLSFNHQNWVINLQNNDKNLCQQGQKRSHQKKTKQKVSLQKIEKPKSILKTHKKQQYNLSSFYYTKSQRTVTFSLVSCNSRNSRSLSPLLSSPQVSLQSIRSGSMTYLQQFPYL